MKKIICVLLSLLCIMVVGCTKTTPKVDKIVSEDNQVIDETTEGGLKVYLNVMDDTINNYKELAKLFKENRKNYSTEELEKYNEDVEEVIQKFATARGSVSTYNEKLNDYYGKILDSLRNLQHASNNLINKDGAGTEEKSIKAYNDSVERMEYIIENQVKLKEEILNSAK